MEVPYYCNKLKNHLVARGMMKKTQVDNNCNLLSVCSIERREMYDSLPIQLINFMQSSHRTDKQRERDNSRCREQRSAVSSPSWIQWMQTKILLALFFFFFKYVLRDFTFPSTMWPTSQCLLHFYAHSYTPLSYSMASSWGLYRKWHIHVWTISKSEGKWIQVSYCTEECFSYWVLGKS